MVAGLVGVGFVLQTYIGSFNFYLLHAPVNLAVGAGMCLVLAVGFFLRNSGIVRWLAGVPMAVSLIAALLAFSIIMGLTPQTIEVAPYSHSVFAVLGFTRVTASWPFVLLYGMTLLCLGLGIVCRMRVVRRGDIAFYCNHFGLWLLLACAGLGAADMQRFVMHVPEGEVEWRVYAPSGEVLELPIAIRLRDFIMEEYPPRLVVINRETGVPQPEGKPYSLQLAVGKSVADMGDWRITEEEYLHEAVRSGDAGFRESPMPASTPAVRVRAVHRRTGEEKTGWICGGGNISGFFSALALDETHTLVMTQPEPKRFLSDITVLTRDGHKASAKLEVNKPLTLGNWTIYQYGYDVRAGKMSTYSSMELVYDAWLYPARVGMVLLVFGACCLIWQGTGKRRHKR